MIQTTNMQSFEYACPRCRSRLQQVTPNELRCPADDLSFPRLDGIWCFLLPERLAYFGRFIQEYETVRMAEGRGSPDPAYYRSLPYSDLTGRRVSDWRIRARSYQAFIKRLLRPYEAELGRPLKVVDAGAGNGWLSYRLAQRGHQVAAVDLLVNPSDGLGAHVHYDAPFTPVQAEFYCLPFLETQFDLLVFIASFHYTTDPAATLQEALRILKPGGYLAILDTPVYQDSSSGDQMVKEREAEFKRRFGFPSNAIPSVNYLTFSQLEQFARQLDLEWQTFAPFYGTAWALRPLKARLLRRREPARFLLIYGRKKSLETGISYTP